MSRGKMDMTQLHRREFLAAAGGALLWAGLPSARGVCMASAEARLLSARWVPGSDGGDARPLAVARMALRGPFPGLGVFGEAVAFRIGVEYPFQPPLCAPMLDYHSRPAVNFSRVHRLSVPVQDGSPLTLLIERERGGAVERQRLQLRPRRGVYVLALEPAPLWSASPRWDVAGREVPDGLPPCFLLRVEDAPAVAEVRA